MWKLFGINDTNKDKFQSKTEDIYTKFIKQYSLKVDDKTPYYFKCTDIEISTITKLVKNITFTL